MWTARKRRVEKASGGVTGAKRVAFRGGEEGRKSDLRKKSCNVHSSARRRPPRASTPPADRQSRQPPPAAAILVNSAHKAVNSGQGGWRSLALIRVGAVAAFGPQTRQTPRFWPLVTKTMPAIGPSAAAVSPCHIPAQPEPLTAPAEPL